jgi:hypothetical protein
MVTIPLFIGFVLLILLAISLSVRASAHQTKRMCLIFVVLPTLGAVDSMQASTVNYAEGFFTVPDYMTEVPADDVRGYDTNPQGRSFVERNSNGQVFLLVASYRDTSQIADEKTWGTIASAPEQRLIQEMQASFATGPAANKTIVDSVKTNVRAHKILSIATISDSGNISKMVTAILVLNNRRSLHLEIYVDKSRFEELFPEMNRIAESLFANPEFQLK